MPTLWKRIAVYSALAALAGFVVWLGVRTPPPPHDATVATALAPPAPARAPAPAPGGDPYRLPPDVRVLQAAGDLHHLITGGPLEDAAADSIQGGWRIVHRGKVIGTLPEVPRFGDLEHLLQRWAFSLGLPDSLRAARGRSSARPRALELASVEERLSRLEATAAADLADRLWIAGRRDPRLLRLAAHALVLLSLETVDEVGGSDRVMARALALVAASTALDPAPMTRDLALLADHMGYAAAAWEKSEGLAPADAARRFVRHEDQALEKQAARRSGTKEARFLALLRIARRHDLDQWQSWLERHFADDRALALPLTCTSLEIGRFEAHLPAATQVLGGVLDDLRMIGELDDDQDFPSERPSLESLMQDFERLMSEMRPKADGVFLDAGVLRAYYRTCFYSALAILGEHLRSSLSSVPDTRAFASELGEGDEGVAGEFQRWYIHLANAKFGKPELKALRKDMVGMPHFGAPLLLATYEAIQQHSEYGDPGLRVAARRLANHLDTRPLHLVAYAAIVQRDVLDLERAETLYAHGIQAGGPLEVPLRAWWARYNRDARSLEDMLRTPGLSPAEQASVLEHLGGVPGIDSSEVERSWERSLASHRGSWELLDGYTQFMRARGEHGRARRALERWLALEVQSTSPFEEIFARTRLARNHMDQGEYDQGIEALEPVVESQELGAMDCMVSLLERAGQLARAETLAVFAWSRYPDSPEAQASVVELCWRQRKYDLAARMLTRAETRLNSSDFRWTLAPRFIECFRASPADGVRAAEALVAVGNFDPMNVSALAMALNEAGHHRMAYEIQSTVPAVAPTAMMRLGWCYHYLKRWKGEDAALAWIAAPLRALGARDGATLACVAYDTREGELLWKIDDAGTGEAREFHWLLRAAASARLKPARDPHRARLEGHFFARPRPGHYQVLGRFLLGREDQAAVLASAADPRSRCEAYYYLGLRSQCDGSIRDAARWYARCIETGQTHNAEYGWALQQLGKWASSECSLAGLAADARRDRRGLVAGR